MQNKATMLLHTAVWAKLNAANLNAAVTAMSNTAINAAFASM